MAAINFEIMKLICKVTGLLFFSFIYLVRDMKQLKLMHYTVYYSQD